ncbi:MAG: radical SAM protein [Planctomycetota bacterium]
MKIALIAAHAHPIALGLRYVSSYLKSAGHEVAMFLMSSRRDTARADYTPAALEDLAQRLREYDLVGVSLMTSNFHRARVLTEHIRQVGITAPVVWGGTHPTVSPDESLEIADAICVGEGEEPMLLLVERLAAGRDPTDIPSLSFRANGGFGNRVAVRNPPAALETRLDDIPFPDYELETHWIADKDGLVPARPENLRGTLHTLRLMTSRGCPYHCTFCNNTALRSIFKDCGKWVRLRSIDNVLGEIVQALACFPTIESVNFVDDLFFVRREEEIEAFAARYNAEVRLPLQMDAFPNTVTDRKVRALAQVPIELISMGIESASADTLANIYQRPTPPPRIAAAIDIFKRHRVRTEYHYIVSNPFEPDENVIETMRFIADHHQGRSILRVFPLMFYPGSPLYQRARAEGLIDTRDRGAYDFTGAGALLFARHDYLAVWLRFVLNLRNIGLPPWVAHRVIDFATSRLTRKVLDRKWFCPTVFVAYKIGRKVLRNLVYQPFIRPFKYLRPRRRPARPAVTTERWSVAEVNRNAQRHRSKDGDEVLTVRTVTVSDLAAGPPTNAPDTFTPTKDRAPAESPPPASP